LQVHHIEEQAEGGGDEENNLIATCSNCHADVHTRTVLTRRFTKKELQLHRDKVYELVAEGKLPSESLATVDAVDEIVKRVLSAPGLQAADIQQTTSINLSAESVEMLLAAARADCEIELHEGMSLPGYVGVGNLWFGDAESNRSRAKYRAALSQLLASSLIEAEYRHYVVSDLGYRFADTLLATTADHKRDSSFQS
jgi:hypothetical protein